MPSPGVFVLILRFWSLHVTVKYRVDIDAASPADALLKHVAVLPLSFVRLKTAQRLSLTVFVVTLRADDTPTDRRNGS